MKVELERGDFFDANFQSHGVCFGLVLSDKVGDLQACAIVVGKSNAVVSLAHLPDGHVPLREERVPVEDVNLLRAAQSSWDLGSQYTVLFFGTRTSESNNDGS